MYTLATGQPIILVTGLATVDETLAVPRNSSSAPPPARAISPGVPPGLASRPIRNITAPAIVVTVATTSRFVLRASKPSSGRIAATGGILAARRAGIEHGEHRDPDADEEGHHDGQRREHDREVGEPGAGGVEDGEDQLGHADAGEDADDGGDDGHHQRLDDDQPADLAPGAADGA